MGESLSIQEGGSRADETAGRRQIREIIETLLATLTDRYRLPLLYYYFQEMTQRQIPQALGVSVGTARTHYHRAKLTLLQKLDRSGWR